MDDIWYVTVPVKGKDAADSIAATIQRAIGLKKSMTDAVKNASRADSLTAAIKVEQKGL